MIVNDSFAVHMVSMYHHGTNDIIQALYETNNHLRLGLTKEDIANLYEPILNNDKYNLITIADIMKLPLTERKVLGLRKFVNTVKTAIRRDVSCQFEGECSTARQAIDGMIGALRDIGVLPKWWQFWKQTV